MAEIGLVNLLVGVSVKGVLMPLETMLKWVIEQSLFDIRELWLLDAAYFDNREPWPFSTRDEVRWRKLTCGYLLEQREVLILVDSVAVICSVLTAKLFIHFFLVVARCPIREVRFSIHNRVALLQRVVIEVTLHFAVNCRVVYWDGLALRLYISGS